MKKYQTGLKKRNQIITLLFITCCFSTIASSQQVATIHSRQEQSSVSLSPQAFIVINQGQVFKTFDRNAGISSATANNTITDAANFSFLVITFKDGREQAIPLENILKIGFRKEAVTGGNETLPPSNSFRELLLSGRSFEGQALQGTSFWPFSIKFITINSISGAMTGEITWKTLNSVHRIEGKLTGDDLSFTETAFIKQGSARLNCSYNLRRNSSSVAGSWSENGQSDGRTAWFNIKETIPTDEETPPVLSSFRNILLKDKSFDGEANQGASIWPFSIKFLTINAQSGALTGELTWKTLNSVHRIEGKLKGNELEFTETAFIKQGAARLNCTYNLLLSSSRAAGTWSENGQSAGRAAWFTIQ